jgi:hypothetical protein
MVDAKRYLRLTPHDLTKIVKKDDGNLYLQFARFDVEFGTLSDPEEQRINIEEIKARQEEIQNELAGIELLFKNIEKI